MTLVDTSIWIAHLRSGHDALIELLERGLVAIHPFVLGELACGNLQRRSTTLGDLASLPRVAVASDDEVLELVESERLWGSGIGWVDAHLLAAAALQPARLLTADKALQASALRLGLVAAATREPR